MRKRLTLISSLAVLALAAAFMQSTVLAHDGKHPDDPNPSPNATASQVVGFTKVSLSYGRPGVKDRTIWGELVPYNGGDPRPWMGGANFSTIITFDEDVKIDGNTIEAGSYGLFLIPAEDEWTIIFSTDSSQYGFTKYTADKDALRIKVAPEEATYQEWLSYDFEKTGELTADLSLHWERLKVAFTIEAPDHRTQKDD
ncbi:MAG: DUF2911 domain-containing protein [Candidatus Hydrogenedentes bacterium]|nr:DUF2911 domain-containing protein [Candidatus Hydrogenedentota bacterium]